MAEWRAVPGYEGLYEVSAAGAVRSLDRTESVTIKGRTSRRQRPGRRLSAPPNSAGYPKVGLWSDGRVRTAGVHALVAEAFLGRRPVGTEVRHLDGDASNNVVANLAYGTVSENAYDAVRHKTHGQTRKVTCPRNHALAGRNIMPSVAARGHRACLACSRAKNNVRHAKERGLPIPDLRDRADYHYRQIREDAA